MSQVLGKSPDDGFIKMASPALQLDNVSVRLSGHLIVDSVSFSVSAGGIGCLLGASGCGKTTLLRAIAGFEPVSTGEILLDGAVVSSPSRALDIEKRHVGMVFQDHSLFPHISVAENIAFGIQTLSSQMREARVKELAGLLEISGLLDAFPHRLSGGQQQRVAIARALAPRPEVLLLDEPFSSLDVELRETLAREIRLVLKQEGITAMLVSHNQFEAFAMADEIGVVKSGRLLQWDNAFNLYHTPASLAVADFIGEGVLVDGQIIGKNAVETELGIIDTREIENFNLPDTKEISLLLRPDDVFHDDASPIKARIVEKAFRGAVFLYTLELESGKRVLSLAPSHHDHDIGEPMGIRLDVEHLVAFPKLPLA